VNGNLVKDAHIRFINHSDWLFLQEMFEIVSDFEVVVTNAVRNRGQEDRIGRLQVCHLSGIA